MRTPLDLWSDRLPLGSDHLVVRWSPINEPTARVPDAGEDVTDVADILELLPEEHAWASSITHPAARRRAVVTRRLLRLTAAELLGVPVGDIVVDHTSQGRPLIVDHPQVHVSAADTRGLACAVASLHEDVGIDTEPIDRDDLPTLFAWLTDAELADILGRPLGEQRLGLLLWWTAKEAARKSRGASSVTSLRCIRVRHRRVPVQHPASSVIPSTPTVHDQHGHDRHGHHPLGPSDTDDPRRFAIGHARWVDRTGSTLEAQITWYRPTSTHLVAVAHPTRSIRSHLAS